MGHFHESRAEPAADEAHAAPRAPGAGESYEGIDVENRDVYVALKDHGLGVYRRDTTTNVLHARRIGLGGLGSTWGVRVQRSHGVRHRALTGQLSTVDVTDPAQPKLLGKVSTGGVARGLAVDGQTAYVAAGSEGLGRRRRVGLDQPQGSREGRDARHGGAGRLLEGHAFVAAWNDARVYDVTNPAAPRFVGAVRLTTDVTYPEHGPRGGHGAHAGHRRQRHTTSSSATGGFRTRTASIPTGPAPSLVLPEEINLTRLRSGGGGRQRTIPIDVTEPGHRAADPFQQLDDRERVHASRPHQLTLEPLWRRQAARAALSPYKRHRRPRKPPAS